MQTKSLPPPDKDIDVGVFSKAGEEGGGKKHNNSHILLGKEKKEEEAAATLAITSYRHRGKQLVRDRRIAEPTVCETRAASEE